MCKNRIKLLLLLGLLLGLVLLVAFLPEGQEPKLQSTEAPTTNAKLSLATTGNKVLGVHVVERESLLELEEIEGARATALWFNGEKTAADIESNTAYISLGTSNWDVNVDEGIILYEDSSAALCFVDSPALRNIESSIRNGEALQLAVVKDGKYSVVNVVFTSLPVISVDGVYQKFGESLGKEIMSGSIRLWHEQESFYSPALWHFRGFGSMQMDKKALKITLMENRVENIHCDLLGLGADDDWILNPMNKDDLDIRERMAMELWNGYFAEESWNYPMSHGQYVELVLNGEYYGLYLIQRRMDQKYLQIDIEKDILFKGRIGYATSAFLYDLRVSPYNDNQSFTYLDNVLTDLGWHNLDRNNFIDVCLFLNYFATHDNLMETNMYFILEDAAESPKLNMVPWDTDMSLGLFVGMGLNYAEASEQLFIRQEYEQLVEKYPELPELMATRWDELRESVFSEESIKAVITANAEQIAAWDAARARDRLKWGYYSYHEDSYEQLLDFCLNRLQFLDAYYNA